jgi:hypothetical protein
MEMGAEGQARPLQPIAEEGGSERVWKISSAPAFEIRTLQQVASYYTNYAIRARYQ